MFGPSNGSPPLLLIHGFGAVQLDWPSQLLAEIATNRQVITFDNIRVAHSTDTANSELSIESMADSLSVFIQQLQLKRPPNIMGFSMGGMIALTLGGKSPGTVGSIVAVSTSTGGTMAPQPAGGIHKVLQRLVPLVLARYNFDDMQGQDESLYSLYFPLGSKDPGVCGLVHHYVTLLWAYKMGRIQKQSLMVSNATLQQQSNAIDLLYKEKDPTEASKGFTKLQKRLLFITGDRDEIIPELTTHRMASMAPGSTEVTIQGAGHALLYSHANTISSVLTDFLDGRKMSS